MKVPIQDTELLDVKGLEIEEGLVIRSDRLLQSITTYSRSRDSHMLPKAVCIVDACLNIVLSSTISFRFPPKMIDVPSTFEQG